MIQNKWMKKILTIVLPVIVLFLAVFFLLLPKEVYSEKENRYLTAFPKWEWESVQSGKYMEDISGYLSDHFPFRDFFMGLKTDVEIWLGKREINDVYIAEDGYLIEVYQKPVNIDRISETLKKFHEKIKTMGVQETHLMLVPTASYVYADKVSPYAPQYNQMKTADMIYEQTGIPKVDCSERLVQCADNDLLYYKTDHHWTTYGAYQGYLSYCEVKGIEPIALELLESEVVTENFQGTIYSKVNDYSRSGDCITLYTNPKDRLTVCYTDTEETTHTLYNLEYLEKKDKYSLFLDNLHTLIEITNDYAESEDVLVLVKDSYANSMVPFLTSYYRKIYVFDTRYYKYGPSKFIEEHPEVTDVLVLYNMNTIDADAGIRGIY